eukprot:8879541-Pyramimonas_sp.AAC.1
MSWTWPALSQVRPAPPQKAELLSEGSQFLATGCRRRDQMLPRTEARTIGRTPAAGPGLPGGKKNK